MSQLIMNYIAADSVVEVPVKLRIVPDGEIVPFRQSPSRFAIAEEKDVQKHVQKLLESFAHLHLLLPAVLYW